MARGNLPTQHEVPPWLWPFRSSKKVRARAQEKKQILPRGDRINHSRYYVHTLPNHTIRDLPRTRSGQETPLGFN